MKTPIAVAPYTVDQIITLIDGGNFVDFDLYTITLAIGTVLRYTTANFDITDGTYIWSARGVRIDGKGTKAVAHWKTGLDTDTWVVLAMPRPFDPITRATFPDKITGVPWIQAAHSGALNDADVVVQRAYFPLPAPTYPLPGGLAVTCAGKLTIFNGLIAMVETEALVARLTINNYNSLLASPMPRNLYAAGCRWTLFDVGCNQAGANPAADFAVSGVVGAGSVRGAIMAPALAAPAGSGTYTLGRIVYGSGQNAGQQMTVADWSNNTLSLVAPLPYAPIAGETFTAYPGCDHSRTQCALFGHLANGNQDNYGGEPYIPDPATAI